MQTTLIHIASRPGQHRAPLSSVALRWRATCCWAGTAPGTASSANSAAPPRGPRDHLSRRPGRDPRLRRADRRAAASRSGRACVLYDQLGNGRSDHLPDADPSFWTVELFERELAPSPTHLGIDGRYHVVGQSWGGMLALLHALERPPGLLSVVAADSPSSIPAFVAGCNELLDAMDPRRARRRSAPASAAARPRRRSSRPRSWSSTSATCAGPIRGPRTSCAASTRWRATRRSTGR